MTLTELGNRGTHRLELVTQDWCEPAPAEGGPPRLEDAFQEIVSCPGCRVGLCARVLEGPLAGESVGIHEDEAFTSASLIKVLVLAELLRQALSGSVSLDEKVLVTDGDLVEDSVGC